MYVLYSFSVRKCKQGKGSLGCLDVPLSGNESYRQRDKEASYISFGIDLSEK